MDNFFSIFVCLLKFVETNDDKTFALDVCHVSPIGACCNRAKMHYAGSFILAGWVEHKKCYLTIGEFLGYRDSYR